MDDELNRLQGLADEHLADNRPGATVHTLGQLTDAADDDLWPTDTDIVDAVVEAFNMDRNEVIDRLARFDAAALRELEPA